MSLFRFLPKVLLIIAYALWPSTSFASEASKTSGGRLGVDGRWAFGGSRITAQDSNQKSISNLEATNTFWMETTAFFPFGLVFGFEELWNQNSTVNFIGSGEKKGEIYLTKLRAGFILYMPIGIFQPWLAAGYSIGNMAITDPKARANDTWLAAFEKESKTFRGSYNAFGLDITGDHFGVRIAYQRDFGGTDAYGVLGYQIMTLNSERLNFGIILPGFF